MIIQKLSLANFRGFEQIDLNFHAEMNVIAGVNGVGKSAVLQAIAHLFSRALPLFTLSRAKAVSLTDDDIKVDSSVINLSAIIEIDGQQYDTNLSRERLSGSQQERLLAEYERLRLEWESETDRRLKDSIGVEMAQLMMQLKPRREEWHLVARTARTQIALTGHPYAAAHATQKLLSDMRSKQSQPQVVYFSTRRLSSERPKTLPASTAFSIQTAFEGGVLAADRVVLLRDIMHWFRVSKLRSENGDLRALAILDTMEIAVRKFIPEFTQLSVTEGSAPQFTLHKNDTKLSLSQLSDGERGVLAIVLDLARRLAIANPASTHPLADGRAIVLIDEIELHLHPGWQRTTLKRLAETFPECQFIVTTHSPQVIGEARPESVILLHDGKATNPAQSFGMDSNWIVEVLMESDSMDANIKARLDAAFKLISDKQLDDATELVTSLRGEVGNSEMLQLAASRIERMRILNK